MPTNLPPDAPDHLFVVRFDAEPPAGAFEGEGPIAGAFLVCYIRADSFFQAIDLAAAALDDEGWSHDEPDYAERCSVAELLEDEELTELVQAALTEGLAVGCYAYEEEDD
ncbi:MAG: hypothetical protein IPJ41_13030 [Phycisphaerales bacterium]|nr:hypothetical protein [Phycisphaerales bacterium]